MNTPDEAATMNYVLDMLGQLTCLAKRAGLEGLAGRIETIITVELAAPPRADRQRSK